MLFVHSCLLPDCFKVLIVRIRRRHTYFGSSPQNDAACTLMISAPRVLILLRRIFSRVKKYQGLWFQVLRLLIRTPHSDSLKRSSIQIALNSFPRSVNIQPHNKTAIFSIFSWSLRKKSNGIPRSYWYCNPRCAFQFHPRRQGTISRLFPRSISVTGYLRRLLVLRSLQLLLR